MFVKDVPETRRGDGIVLPYGSARKDRFEIFFFPGRIRGANCNLLDVCNFLDTAIPSKVIVSGIEVLRKRFFQQPR